MATDREARELLAAALDLFNDRPNFGLRRDPQQTSYRLAARISAGLSVWSDAPHPAIAVARDRWDKVDFLRVDGDERIVEHRADGYWVRAWIRIALSNVGEMAPELAARYRDACEALPEPSRSILAAHQQDGLDYRAVASRFDITVDEVERHIASALIGLVKALGKL